MLGGSGCCGGSSGSWFPVGGTSLDGAVSGSSSSGTALVKS